MEWQDASVKFAEHDDDWLTCPACGSYYLHQECMTVFDRHEDGKETRIVNIGKGTIVSGLVPSDETENPSRRRHGISIQFSCEQCPANLELTIAQHKGLEIMKWRFKTEDKRWLRKHAKKLKPQS